MVKPLTTMEYALEALRLFGMAGRCVPFDRLVAFGDEEGRSYAVSKSAQMVVWRLRRAGFNVELVSYRHGLYRLLTNSGERLTNTEGGART